MQQLAPSRKARDGQIEAAEKCTGLHLPMKPLRNCLSTVDLHQDTPEALRVLLGQAR
ncbi:MAG: hypothetical protein ABI748_12355 [Dokdonella sp.]